MARIRKRGSSQYQARVRIQGYPEVARSFPSNAEAVLWVNQREQQLLRGLSDAIKEADSLTLGDALARYSTEINHQNRSQYRLA